MSITPDAMKETLRLWASGVTLVTTANETGRVGTTASSFTSVSLEPPLILICLYHEATVLKHIQENRYFAVSILGKGQDPVSNQMAGYAPVPEGEDRFYGYDWFNAETQAPIYKDAIGWLDCSLHAIYDGGTHKIVLGEVLETGNKLTADPDPLLYFNRGYRDLFTE
jgi:3-hydroxy-9,10-secoandrosta-1,3,5(10)-triene-9,17-dione monooxygenase reductase component